MKLLKRGSTALIATVLMSLFVSGLEIPPAAAQTRGEASIAALPKKNNQTVLLIQRLFGPVRQDAASVTVKVNGTIVLENDARWQDISGLVKPGANAVTLSAENTGVVLTVSHAENAGVFRRLASFSRRKKETVPRQTVTFTLPGSATLDEKDGKAPRAGSNEQQLILRVQMQKPVIVYINDKKAGNFQNVMNLDIGNLAKPGRNRLRVVWSEAGTRGLIRAAYADSKNGFHDLGTVRIQGEDSRKVTGEKVRILTSNMARQRYKKRGSCLPLNTLGYMLPLRVEGKRLA